MLIGPFPAVLVSVCTVSLWDPPWTGKARGAEGPGHTGGAPGVWGGQPSPAWVLEPTKLVVPSPGRVTGYGVAPLSSHQLPSAAAQLSASRASF